MEVLVTQSCLTLCDPVDCSPPGSSVHGILQARVLEWVAIPFPRGIFPNQELNSRLLHWQAGSLLSESNSNKIAKQKKWSSTQVHSENLQSPPNLAGHMRIPSCASHQEQNRKPYTSRKRKACAPNTNTFVSRVQKASMQPVRASVIILGDYMEVRL